MNIQTAIPTAIDLAAVKTKQQATWSSGDYTVIGTTLQIVGETLCEAIDLRSNQRVLDVAAGNGNATLAAARRFADVVSTDYVPALLERGSERATAERLPVRSSRRTRKSCPSPTPVSTSCCRRSASCSRADQQQAANEMLRVCRRGGKIGLANWTPEGFTGQVFKTIGKYVPPAPGMKSPAAVGHRAASRRPVRFKGDRRATESRISPSATSRASTSWTCSAAITGRC